MEREGSVMYMCQTIYGIAVHAHIPKRNIRHPTIRWKPVQLENPLSRSLTYRVQKAFFLGFFELRAYNVCMRLEDSIVIH